MKGVSVMNIADRIQNLRKIKGISQEELADKVGVSRQAVSKWESEQSMPDLDKVIIMSEYFGVTTDYILKGIEPTHETDKNNNSITGQILYIGSTAFIFIGLLSAFAGCYTDQSTESIWGSMIIQIVGVVGYFIGNVLSQSKAPFIINWLNINIALFMPISLVVTKIFNRVIAPYPTDKQSGIVFLVFYVVALVLSFFILKRHKE